MIRLNNPDKTFIVIRPKVKDFLSKHVPPDDMDIVVKSLIADYFTELYSFNIFEEMLKHPNKEHALFIFPHSIYTTVGKASSDVFISGVFTFDKNQFARHEKIVDANISFIIGFPSEIIKLIKSLNNRDLNVSYFMKPSRKYTNKYDVDFSLFNNIDNK